MIGLLIGSVIYLLSHDKPPKPQTPKTTTDYQDYINHEAAQQADLIDAEISIAINQVRKLNEQKLSYLITEQSDATPKEQTPHNQDNPNSQD